jgi:hypothetical protein
VFLHNPPAPRNKVSGQIGHNADLSHHADVSAIQAVLVDKKPGEEWETTGQPQPTR